MIEWPTYIKMRLHCDGEKPKELRIPTLWDDVEGLWRAILQTPRSLRLIMATGLNSFDLQNDVNRKISEILERQDDLADELWEMFEEVNE
jgi:hypothetical protein